MFPLMSAGQKVVVAGIMAIIYMLNLGIGAVINGEIQTKVNIFNHLETPTGIRFYGEYIVNDKNLPLILTLKTKETDKNIITQNNNINNNNINKKEEKIDKKINENINSKYELIIDGKKVVFKHEIGSKEITDFDKQEITKIHEGILNYIERINPNQQQEQLTNEEKKKIKNILNDFKDYCNKRGKRKSLLQRFFTWL